MPRYKYLKVSTEFLFNLMRGEHWGYKIIENEVPEDAKLVNVRHGWPNSIDLLIESETFDEVLEGQEIPFLIPIAKSHAPL